MNFHDTSAALPIDSAVSAWPDTDALYRRFHTLVNQPIRPIRRDAMEKVLGYFEQRCQQSFAMAEQAKQVIPGGVQHNLAFNYPFPIAVKSAQGAHMTDVDGNHYIDFLQAGLPRLKPCCRSAAQSPGCCTNMKSNWPSWCARPCPPSTCCA